MADLAVYEAQGKRGGIVRREIGALGCPSCKRVFVSDYHTDRLDALANRTKKNCTIVPEIGLVTPTTFEVFALLPFASYGDAPCITNMRSGGVSISFGEQSRLFGAALTLLTDLDEGDHGHDLSTTLRVRPPPPYDAAQRCALLALIARASLRLGSSISFWSRHIKETDYDSVDEDHGRPTVPCKTLLEKVLSWQGDHDRVALALVNEITTGAGPGRFINAFRFLELILHRLVMADIASARRDPSVADAAFLDLVNRSVADLKTRLKDRVERTTPRPEEVLRELWRIASPGRPFDPGGVYEVIATFRNRFAHRPPGGKDLLLPWETPDVEGFSWGIIELVESFL